MYVAEPPTKTARTEGPEAWTCGKCGNHNFDGRTTCNMRKCGALHPDFEPQTLNGANAVEADEGWDCGQCGNHNFKGRDKCNMRSCGAPRPGGQKIQPMNAKLNQQTNEDGWECPECGNHNFANRFYCNMRKCGAPGPWTCPQCQNQNYASRNVCNKRSCAHPRPAPPPGCGPKAFAGQIGANGMGAAGGMGHKAPAGGQVNSTAAAQAMALLQASGLTSIPGVAQALGQINACAQPFIAPNSNHAAAKPQQQYQPGSWVCLACGNVNFPNRTSCNSRNCQKPRDEVDGGPPATEGPVTQAAAAAAAKGGPTPPGSWLCGACNNVNWPKRESCGKRTCGKPRSEVDAGPAPGC